MFKFFSDIQSKVKLSNTSIFNLLALTFSILYIFVFAFFGGSATTGNSIFQGVVIFCLTVLLVEIYVIRDQLPDHFDTVRQNLVAEIDSLKNQLSEYKKAEAFTRNVKNSLNGEVFSILTEEVKKAVKIGHDNQSFSVKGECWVLDSYETLWKRLTEKKAIFGTTLICSAFHCCDINIWLDHPKASRFYALQESFIENGGVIMRTLCGRGKTPNNQFQEVAKKMKEIKIDVSYYDIDSGKVGHSFSWDFLVVRNENNAVICAVIWTEFNNQVIPTLAYYGINDEYDGKSLSNIGGEIQGKAIEFPTDSSTSPTAVIT